MANFWYDEATRALANKELDLDTDDLRVVLVSTNTTADTERDKTTVAGFTTLDEFNGANYSVQAISGRSISVNGTSHRAEVPAATSSWSAVGAGTRAIQAAIVVKWGGSLGASIPLLYFDDGGFPITASGADLSIVWDPTGMAQVGPSV